MLEVLSIFLMPSAIFAILSIVAATAYARHKLKTAGTRYSRLYFALLTLTVSQIVFLISAILILVATFGFALFLGTLFVFANGVGTLTAVLIAAIGYDALIGRAYSRKAEDVVSRPNASIEWTKALVALIFVSFSFVFLGGVSTIRDIAIAYAVKTNNTDLIDFQKYGRGYEYLEIAKNTKDPSMCDNIPGARDKASCYVQSDPEFARYMQTCELYTKHGDLESSYQSQYECVIDMRIAKVLENGGVLDCSALSEEFKSNTQVAAIVSRCESVEQLQRIGASGDSSMCSGYLERPITAKTYFPRAYMACLGFFVGSADWKNACDHYAKGTGIGPNPTTPPFELMRLAKCPAYEKYFRIDAVMDVFDRTPPPYQLTG